MTTPAYLADPTPGHGARLAPRAFLHSDAPALSLNGDWRFRLSPTADLPDDVADPALDDTAWQTMPVPAHWVLQGDGEHGLPIYTNVRYPFPIDPPHVPDENPTGDYRRTFDLPADWAADDAAGAAGTATGAPRVVLRFDGVESMYRVWMNGTEVGISTGSRLAQEFDVTGLVHPGDNHLAVRVHQWSPASYLEDQDQWWLPGIFRDVTLVARPADGFDDVWLRTDWREGQGRLAAEITASAAAFPVTLRIPELGVETVWQTPAAAAESLPVGPVDPWSAEAPRLYDATVSAQGETVSLRLGFRTVEIVGDRFLVNGRRVVFHGMNRHEAHPVRGRVFDEEHAREDLARMKRFNVNAIRTSHYPPHPRLLDLADELGFWVILECDLETHGFGNGDWHANPSDDPQWRAAYLDRIQRTVERDKNHPSIVMWSLGNESHTGANLAAMSAWVHARDTGRPVHYEGDYTGEYTDVYSRMYSSVPETEQIGTDGSLTPILGCTPAQGARQRTKPFILCEYAHAMGNGPGALDQYEALTRAHPRLHGGFVWEWRDHGILTHTADGTPFYAYGGDFGEVIHDGNFVMDGMILSNDVPTPGLHEFKAVVQPLEFAFAGGHGRTAGDSGTVSAPGTAGDPGTAGNPGTAGDPGTVTITNLRHTADTGDLELRWRVEHDGREVASGTLDAPVIAAGDSATVVLPSIPVADDAETWFTVDAVLAAPATWTPADHVVASAQLDRSARRLPAPAPARIHSWEDSDGTLTLGPATFERGSLVALSGTAVAGPRLELFRAPTDNDGGAHSSDPVHSDASIPGTSSATLWRDQVLDRLTHRVVAVQRGTGPGDVDALRTLTRVSPADGRASVTVETVWTLVDGALDLRVEIEPSTGWDTVWPRIGVRFDLPDGSAVAAGPAAPGDSAGSGDSAGTAAPVTRASWFGTGPLESYPDSTHAAHVGRFEASLDELNVPYARPQETGHRSAVRSLDIGALSFTAIQDAQGRLPGFSLSRHTPQQVAAAAHPHELPPSSTTYLFVDAAQHGLGSRACGPDVWPTFALRPEARTIRLRFES